MLTEVKALGFPTLERLKETLPTQRGKRRRECEADIAPPPPQGLWEELLWHQPKGLVEGRVCASIVWRTASTLFRSGCQAVGLALEERQGQRQRGLCPAACASLGPEAFLRALLCTGLINVHIRVIPYSTNGEMVCCGLMRDAISVTSFLSLFMCGSSSLR